MFKEKIRQGIPFGGCKIVSSEKSLPVGALVSKRKCGQRWC